MSSLLVQVTVVPAGTVSVAALNAKLSIATAAGDAATAPPTRVTAPRAPASAAMKAGRRLPSPLRGGVGGGGASWAWARHWLAGAFEPAPPALAPPRKGEVSIEL